MKKIIYTLAYLHLLLITLTIFHVLDPIYNKYGFLEKTLAFVCRINYSVWRYGFFSPDVGNSNEVEIKTYHISGKDTTYSTLRDFNFYLSNHDLAKRFYGFKVYNAADTMVQDLCARSVATRMINLHPGTYKISYTLRSIRYPSMHDFLNGKPIKKRELYTTDFILNP
jgi:hypothetical protein